MKATYVIEQTRTAQGELDLDLDAEIEWDRACTDIERRVLIERLAIEQADRDGAWAYSHNMDFRVSPDQEEEP